MPWNCQCYALKLRKVNTKCTNLGVSLSIPHHLLDQNVYTCKTFRENSHSFQKTSAAKMHADTREQLKDDRQHRRRSYVPVFPCITPHIGPIMWFVSSMWTCMDVTHRCDFPWNAVYMSPGPKTLPGSAFAQWGKNAILSFLKLLQLLSVWEM